TGRRLAFTDRDDIDRIVEHSAASGYKLRDLVQAIVASRSFQTK
ncbi:MAG TPA: DUF1585 domain-containing protein, partial [Planctomycetes bacterium]|nr:DUF1585 domain-containing protein [Verrucomicrobiales bacterium]HIM30955.1 DUF1585 domain-containing protein [Planctomycetota bacterium]